jgi:hypothetical protein
MWKTNSSLKRFTVTFTITEDGRRIKPPKTTFVVLQVKENPESQQKALVAVNETRM